MAIIEKMNAMFQANPYTDKGRVVVDYASNCGVVVVKVMDTTEIIMFAVMDKVREMYDR